MSIWACFGKQPTQAKLLLVVLLVCLPMCSWGGAEGLAAGVIVKLKEAGPVVPPSLQRNPSRWSMQSITRQRMRLLALAWRQGIPVTSIEQTAYGAYLLRGKQVEPLLKVTNDAIRVKRDADVEWAVPNTVERYASVSAPNDSLYDQQIWLSARGPGLMALPDFLRAWTTLQGRNLSKVTVAVLDSGVPVGHHDLVGAILPGYDFVSDTENARDGDGVDVDASDPGNWLTEQERAANPGYYAGCPVRSSSWHGLAIAGMLAANTNNDFGVAGMLWQLPGPLLLPVRVAGSCGAEVNDIIEGMLWAGGISYQGSPPLNANPARVLNLSLGGDGSCAGDLAEGSPGWLYVQTIQALKARGVLVVASAGNGDADGVGMAGPTRPANCPGVLAVTGLQVKGFKARYSNLLPDNGAGIATFSGEDAGGTTETGHLITTMHSGATDLSSGSYVYRGMVGTSFAAPMVAGTAAMMLALNPNLSVDQLITGIQRTAAPHLSSTDAFAQTLPELPVCDHALSSNREQCLCTTSTCGAGILNVDGALQYALNTVGDQGPIGGAQVNFFVPDRARQTMADPSPSGGGGGALDPATLAFISMLLGLTLLAGGKR